MIEIKNLKEAVINHQGESSDVNKFIAYIDSINKTDRNGKDLLFNMKSDQLLKLYIKYINVGIVLDGVNAVITAYERVFITWVGYKNKVLSVYPESEFDVQLVRDGDMFQVAKQSGKVVYTHDISDPFSSNKGIIGAYCIIKNKRGEALETLGLDDYDKMKQSAMMKSTWDKWASEFWLKSVIKRACKRHFNDIVEEIDKLDNQDYQNDEDNSVSERQKLAILDSYDGKDT